MKQATQLALIGTISVVVVLTINLIFCEFMHVEPSTYFYIIIQITNLFGMVTLVNFFYKLYQKQNQKLQADNTNQFKE